MAVAVLALWLQLHLLLLEPPIPAAVVVVALTEALIRPARQVAPAS